MSDVEVPDVLHGYYTQYEVSASFLDVSLFSNLTCCVLAMFNSFLVVSSFFCYASHAELILSLSFHLRRETFQCLKQFRSFTNCCLTTNVRFEPLFLQLLVASVEVDYLACFQRHHCFQALQHGHLKALPVYLFGRNLVVFITLYSTTQAGIGRQWVLTTTAATEARVHTPNRYEIAQLSTRPSLADHRHLSSKIWAKSVRQRHQMLKDWNATADMPM